MSIFRTVSHSSARGCSGLSARVCSGGGIRWLLGSPLQYDSNGRLLDTLWTDGRSTSIQLADHEGLIREIPVDKMPVQGGRVVKSLWPQTDNSDTPTTQTITVVSGHEYHLQIGAGSAVGATAVCSGAFTGTLTGDGADKQSWANGTPKTATTTSLTVTISGAVTNIQLEDVTGAADQNPGEYEPVSATEDGFGIYNCANPHSVDAFGVVTKGALVPLSPAPVIVHAPGSTNEVWRSFEFNTLPWSPQGGGITVTEGDTISLNGAVEGNKISLIGSTGFLNHSGSTFNWTSGETWTFSVYLKSVSGSAETWTLNWHDGTHHRTDISITGEWQRYTITFSPGTTATGHVYIIDSRSGTVTGDAYAWGAQLEEQPFATPIIPTLGGPGVRSAVQLQYPYSDAVFNQDEGYLVFDWAPHWAYTDYTSHQSLISLSAVLANLAYANSGAQGTLSSYDSTNASSVGGINWPANKKHRVAVRWSSSLNELQIGVVNITDAGAWVWDTTPGAYDGEFANSSLIRLFFSGNFMNTLHDLQIFNKDRTTTEIEARHP